METDKMWTVMSYCMFIYLYDKYDINKLNDNNYNCKYVGMITN